MLVKKNQKKNHTLKLFNVSVNEIAFSVKKSLGALLASKIQSYKVTELEG